MSDNASPPPNPPGYPKDGTYADLLFWHLYVWGTRHDGSTTRWGGRIWNTGEFIGGIFVNDSDGGKSNEKTHNSWIGKSKKPWRPQLQYAVKISAILFGNNSEFIFWINDLEEAWKRSRRSGRNILNITKDAALTELAKAGYLREAPSANDAQKSEGRENVAIANETKIGLGEPDIIVPEASEGGFDNKETGSASKSIPFGLEAGLLIDKGNASSNSVFKLGYATLGPPLKNIPGLFEVLIHRPPQGEFPESIRLLLSLNAGVLIVNAENTQWQIGLTAYTIHGGFRGAQLLPDSTPNHPLLIYDGGLWRVNCKPNESSDSSSVILRGDLLQDLPFGILTHDHSSAAIVVFITVLTSEFDLDVRPYIGTTARVNSSEMPTCDMSECKMETRERIMQRFVQKYSRKDGNIHLGGGSMNIPVERIDEHD